MHTTTTPSFKTLLHTAALITILLGPITSLFPGFLSGGGLGYHGGNRHNLAAAGIPIPISYKRCTSDRFDPLDARLAMEGLLKKFKGEGEVGDVKLRRRNSYHSVHGTAVFYICNCNKCESQVFPESETREVMQILADEDCGPGRGGWVWSMQYNRGWALASASALGGPDRGSRDLCPARCVAEIWDGAPPCEFWAGGTATTP